MASASDHLCIYTFSCNGSVMHHDYKLLKGMHGSILYYNWIMTEFPDDLGWGLPGLPSRLRHFSTELQNDIADSECMKEEHVFALFYKT